MFESLRHAVGGPGEAAAAPSIATACPPVSIRSCSRCACRCGCNAPMAAASYALGRPIFSTCERAVLSFSTVIDCHSQGSTMPIRPGPGLMTGPPSPTSTEPAQGTPSSCSAASVSSGVRNSAKANTPLEILQARGVRTGESRAALSLAHARGAVCPSCGVFWRELFIGPL
jgi:hypothetical protein